MKHIMEKNGLFAGCVVVEDIYYVGENLMKINVLITILFNTLKFFITSTHFS